MRRWTDRRRSLGASTTLADTLADVYMGVLAAVIALASALYAARDAGALSAGAGGGAGRIDAGWVWLLALAAALLSVVRFSRRLGPVGLDRERVRWWLPLPVDRLSLIGPAAWRWPALGAVVGGGLGAVAAAALGGQDVAAGPVASAAALAAALTGAACLALVPAQARGPAAHADTAGEADGGPSGGHASAPESRFRRRATGRAVEVATGGALLVVVAGALVVLVAAPDVPALPPVPVLLAVAGLGLAAAVVAGVLARSSVARIPDAELARGGGVAGSAGFALTTLDTRTLGALAVGEGATVVRRRAGWGLLARLPRAVRAPAALVAADAVATLRRPSLALRPLLAVLALALVADVRAAPGWVLPVAVGALGYVSACASATGARIARTHEGLDAHLPMSARAHRVTRLVWSWVALAPFVVGAAVVVGTHAGGGRGPVLDVLMWVPVLAAAALGWAGAALRWAYRKDDTGTGPVAPSPMGPVPVGSIMLLLTGPDVAVVASVAVGLAIWAGTPLGLLTAVALAVSLLVAAVVTSPPPPYEH
ncbi:DUF6297 family protein [Georgenia sp. Z1491]|uniref:DUF6297 family protein n=1 Tax=Georgenia sp. Z1491 TaxID=3416707 RepID=UPI003CF3E351